MYQNNTVYLKFMKYYMSNLSNEKILYILYQDLLIIYIPQHLLYHSYSLNRCLSIYMYTLFSEPIEAKVRDSVSLYP